VRKSIRSMTPKQVGGLDVQRSSKLLRVDFAATWSCYEGRALHCGRCDTCYERREAFQLAGVPNPM
jgi:7-cyano-7-deazaguanine synthase